jgi:uncharacterized protein
MPEYLYPGVYVEEIERGPRPIEGVPTSTAAFLGETERGALYPRLVTSFNEYQRWYGSVFQNQRFMPHAISGFFENGGRRLYVCRIVGQNATPAVRQFGNFNIAAVGPGAWGRRIWVRIQEGSTKRADGQAGFRLKFAYWSTSPQELYDPFNPANRRQLPRPQIQEDFDDLSSDPLSSDYYGKRLLDSNTNLPVSALASIERIDPNGDDMPESIRNRGALARLG